jgi:high-affinity Fe2+/Pb2+ permease
MTKAVIAKLSANSAKLAAVPAIAPTLAKLSQCVQVIETKETERGDQSTGKLEVRDEAEDVLVELMVQGSSSLTAFASSSKNIELYEKAKIKKSVLHRLRGNELLLKAKSTLTLLQQYADQLVPFGITAELITSFEQAISSFEAASANVDKGFSGRSGARLSVNEAFDESDVIIKDQLDNLMESVKKIDLQLYNEYKVARVIHDLGGGRDTKKGGQTPPAQPPAK